MQPLSMNWKVIGNTPWKPATGWSPESGDPQYKYTKQKLRRPSSFRPASSCPLPFALRSMPCALRPPPSALRSSSFAIHCISPILFINLIQQCNFQRIKYGWASHHLWVSYSLSVVVIPVTDQAEVWWNRKNRVKESSLFKNVNTFSEPGWDIEGRKFITKGKLFASCKKMTVFQCETTRQILLIYQLISWRDKSCPSIRTKTSGQLHHKKKILIHLSELFPSEKNLKFRYTK